MLGGELGIISHVREEIIMHDDPSSGLTDVSLQVTKILEQQLFQSMYVYSAYVMGDTSMNRCKAHVILFLESKSIIP